MRPDTDRRRRDKDARAAERARFALDMAQAGVFVEPAAYYASYYAEMAALFSKGPPRG